MRRAACLLAILALTPAGALAWGGLGHRLVCAVALHQLPADHRDEVERLAARFRQPHGRGFRYFTGGCLFADIARGKARTGSADWSRYTPFNRWHFVNFPRSADRPTREHCGDDCVLTGIERHFREFANHDLPETRRAEAMLLLAHWVADAHQPLHVAFEDDRGGNDIAVGGGYYRQDNLHAVWDTGVVERAVGDADWWEFAGKLSAGIAGNEARAWRDDPPQSWLQESARITLDGDFSYCRQSTTMAGQRCEAIAGDRRLDGAYQARWQDVALDRITRAGVRLAALLSRGLRQ